MAEVNKSRRRVGISMRRGVRRGDDAMASELWQWVHTAVGPALIWSGLRPAGSGDDLPGTSGRIHRRPLFGGAAEE